MAKANKITFLEIYKKIRKSWGNKNPKTQIRKNKRRKSRQQNKIDLKKEH